MSFAEAIEVALCFGWINDQGKSFDDQWFLSRFTPRRPQSTGSKRNVKIVSRLTEAGRIHPAGIAAVEAAKADDRWNRAYAGPASIEAPKDFTAALAKDPAAASFFEGLNRTCRYGVLLRTETASPQSRDRTIDLLVKNLATGKIPGRTKTGRKPKKSADIKAPKARADVPKSGQATHEQAKLRHRKTRDLPKEPRRSGLRPRS